MRLGFVTARFLGGLCEDDQPAARALERRGAEVVPLVWDEPLDGRALDALVIRSPWDWYERRPAFRAFLERLPALGCPVFNPPAMLTHFADKTYFETLAALGVETVPTVFFTPGQLDEVPATLAQRGWTTVVLKPSFTANAAGAHRFEARSARAVIAAAKQTPIDSRWMLQPYLDAVERDGEWSLVFFGGRFSHAARKRPRPGDYRVQPEHGGRAELAEAPPHILDAAGEVVRRAVPDALYARVDGVDDGGVFRLMELEVVEPQLFFLLHPLAAERFADALLAALAVSPS